MNKVKFRAIGQHLYSMEYFVTHLLNKTEDIRIWIRLQRKKDIQKKVECSLLTEHVDLMNQKLEQLKKHIDKQKEHYISLCKGQGWEDILKQVQNVESSLYSTHLDMRAHPHVVQEYDTGFKKYEKKKKE
jgi:tRNA U34 5-carboxymethylaminomethyl modifying GTPase MnmE/TrmE